MILEDQLKIRGKLKIFQRDRLTGFEEQIFEKENTLQSNALPRLMAAWRGQEGSSNELLNDSTYITIVSDITNRDIQLADGSVNQDLTHDETDASYNHGPSCEYCFEDISTEEYTPTSIRVKFPDGTEWSRINVSIGSKTDRYNWIYKYTWAVDPGSTNQPFGNSAELYGAWNKLVKMMTGDSPTNWFTVSELRLRVHDGSNLLNLNETGSGTDLAPDSTSDDGTSKLTAVFICQEDTDDDGFGDFDGVWDEVRIRVNSLSDDFRRSDSDAIGAKNETTRRQVTYNLMLS